MSAVTKGVFIVGAKRTAFGTLGGTLKDVTCTQMQTHANKATLEAAGVRPDQVDTFITGYIAPSQSDAIYIPRHSALLCGIPIDRPALCVNRVCGSGFQSIVNAAQDIMLGAARIALTGGVDNLSLSPFIVRNIRFGSTLGVPNFFEDSSWLALTDTYCKSSLAITAENIAVKYKIPRERVDKFALRSQQLWKAANDQSIFKTEIAPFPIKVKGKNIEFAIDENAKPHTTIEGLAKLKPVFKKDGVVTPGNVSGFGDGAAAVLLASEEACSQNNLKPLARLSAYSAVGVAPEIMGMGPVPAIQNILKVSGLTLNDIDLVEMNEAFGVQTLACADVLGLDLNKLNVNGGSIALGHPLAASGSRIAGHLVHELKRKGLKRAIGATSIGGGQGIAVLIESV